MRPPRAALLAILAAAASSCGGQGELSDQAAQFADFRGAKDDPTYRAVLVEAAPKVDGEMDPAYEAAEPIRFVFINGARRSPKVSP